MQAEIRCLGGHRCLSQYYRSCLGHDDSLTFGPERRGSRDSRKKVAQLIWLLGGDNLRFI